MNSLDIFARRLRNARTICGFSMDDLVRAMGNTVSKMTISKYEKAQISPNSSILISLSRALNQPVDYFFRPFSLSVKSVKFRKRKSNLSAKQERSIRESISDLVERYINIEEICNATVNFCSPFTQRISSISQVKEAAAELRKIWNIGTDGIVNVIELLEEHGVKVMEIDAPASFDGLSSMVNNLYPVIILNNNFCSERKRFTALHELGHLILAFEDSVSENDEEKMCNLFASEMLIPEPVFKSIVDSFRHDISYQELRAIQMQYGISCDALMYKAFSCGIISENRKRYYFMNKNRNSLFKQRVEQSVYPNETSSRFNRLVYKALSNDFITVSKAAALLHQSVEQTREDLVLV